MKNSVNWMIAIIVVATFFVMGFKVAQKYFEQGCTTVCVNDNCTKTCPPTIRSWEK